MVFSWLAQELLTPVRRCGQPTEYRKLNTDYLYTRIHRKRSMKKIRKFYNEYKPYVFSDGWYYVFIVVFILILFIFFS